MYVVGLAGAVIVCVIAPPSDQLPKTFRVLAFPCGDVVPMLCDDPGVQLNVCGDVYVVPSTVILKPAGLVVTVY